VPFRAATSVDRAANASTVGAARRGGPDVFVSYSRVDEEFVRRLDDALGRRGKESWIDWDDIPATADWRARIYAGIEAARVFVAVLSPDLVASEICLEELAHATRSNKRVVPVVRREVDRPLRAGAASAIQTIACAGMASAARSLRRRSQRGSCSHAPDEMRTQSKRNV
jgi:hypothetical protein